MTNARWDAWLQLRVCWWTTGTVGLWVISDAGRVRGYQWSAASRQNTEVWHQGRKPGVNHTPWSRVMKRKIRIARAVAGLTGRIETIVVLIPRSDMKSPVDAEEYLDRPHRRPPIGQVEQGKTNLLHQLQEDCTSRPSAQRSPLSDELDTPTGILIVWVKMGKELYRATILLSSFERTDRF